MSISATLHRVHMCTLLCTWPGQGRVGPTSKGPYPTSATWERVHTVSPVGVCTFLCTLAKVPSFCPETPLGMPAGCRQQDRPGYLQEEHPPCHPNAA